MMNHYGLPTFTSSCSSAPLTSSITITMIIILILHAYLFLAGGYKNNNSASSSITPLLVHQSISKNKAASEEFECIR